MQCGWAVWLAVEGARYQNSAKWVQEAKGVGSALEGQIHAKCGRTIARTKAKIESPSEW